MPEPAIEAPEPVTDERVVPAPTPSAPQQTSAAVPDGLLALFMELPRERERLGALEDPSTRKLAREIADTVLPLIQDFIGESLTERSNAHHFRDWVLQKGLPARDVAIGDLNDRLLELEQRAPEAMWDEDTALLILEVAGMLKARCESDLAGNPALDAAIKQELQDAVAKCDLLVEQVADAEGDGEYEGGEELDEPEPEPEPEPGTGPNGTPEQS